MLMLASLVRTGLKFPVSICLSISICWHFARATSSRYGNCDPRVSAHKALSVAKIIRITVVNHQGAERIGNQILHIEHVPINL